MSSPSHRPHAPHHDYSARGIYLITIVVSGREPVLGTLNDDPHHPAVVLSEIGLAVATEWERTEAVQAQKGNRVRILCKCVMPDHFHGVIFVEEPMSQNLGMIIRGFKQACNRALRHWYGFREDAPAPTAPASTAPPDATSSAPSPTREASPSRACQARTLLLRRLAASKGIRDSRLASGVLFDPDYDDTLLIGGGQLSAMIRYVQDNPRRAILRRLHPDLMARCLHIRLGNRDYAAFGNLFLLRRPLKEPVMCHRWRMDGNHRDTSTPYDTTADFARRRDEWIDMARHGVVLVTPAISRGEQIIKHICLSEGLPLIHIQKEPITPYWKPERSRFEACANGTLLILAPFAPALIDPVSRDTVHPTPSASLAVGTPPASPNAAPPTSPLTPHIPPLAPPSHPRSVPAAGLPSPHSAPLGASPSSLGVAHPAPFGVPSSIPSTSDYAIFHNLNAIAREICAFQGEALILRS